MIPQSHLISEDIVFDRALAALTGLAIGDALGMPSQTLPPQDIKTHYGTITGFVAPFPDHPVSHGLTAGQVTDDTEQALILAARLIEGGGDIDERQLAKDFLAWEENVKARGLRDLLGPSTKLALDAILAGQPLSETGKAGTTNGAAMRITPIGIATPIDHLETFVDKVEMACRMTHNTGEAIASAAAVAAVISCGLNGHDFASATKLALLAADIGQKRGYQVGETDMAQRIKMALSLAEGKTTITDIAKSIGNSVASHESVAAAFAIVRLADGDPWQAALMAANIGDDTIYGGTGDDTIKGGAGEDTIYGGDDDDTINGQDNNDYIDGGHGDDTIFGDLGDDVLFGSAGKDVLIGGLGSDTFVLHQGANDYYDADIVRDFSAEDKIRVDTLDGDEITVAELLAAAYLRVEVGHIAFDNFTSGNDNSELMNTGIYYTQGTEDTSDDILLMVLEDFSTDLTINNFDIV